MTVYRSRIAKPSPTATCPRVYSIERTEPSLRACIRVYTICFARFGCMLNFVHVACVYMVIWRTLTADFDIYTVYTVYTRMPRQSAAYRQALRAS